jgi:hypothetical protein
MIAMTGYFKYLRRDFGNQGISAYARSGEAGKRGSREAGKRGIH